MVLTDGRTLFYIRTDKDTHFTTAVAQHNSEEEDIVVADYSNPSYETSVLLIHEARIQSDQQLHYKLWFSSTDDFDDTDLDLDRLIEPIEFELPTYFERYKNANQYRLSKRMDVAVLYYDEDGTAELHLALENLSPTGKNAGATGEVVIELLCSLPSGLMR